MGKLQNLGEMALERGVAFLCYTRPPDTKSQPKYINRSAALSGFYVCLKRTIEQGEKTSPYVVSINSILILYQFSVSKFEICILFLFFETLTQQATYFKVNVMNLLTY